MTNEYLPTPGRHCKHQTEPRNGWCLQCVHRYLASWHAMRSPDEPPAECAQRDAREVVPAASLPPELQEAAKEFAGLFGQKQATREVNCLWCDGTGKVTVSALNRSGDA